MPLIDPAYFEFAYICRLIGLIGVSVYVIGFFCLCSGKLDSKAPTYFIMNFTAASCVMVSLMADFNLSAALIQVFYATMSVGGIILRVRQSRSNRRVSHAAA